MKITRLFAILFAILSLVLVLTLVGCQKDNGNQNVPGGNTSPACEHVSTTVTSNCEKVCVTCGKVLETDLHRDHIVNFRCEEVCPVCNEVFKTGVHDEGVINDDCERICTRCGMLCETDVHADKVINDKCEEVCSRCDKVYATGIHDEGAYGENCDKACTRCGTTLATGEHGETVVNDKCEEVCVRCNKVMATGVHGEKIVNDKLKEVCSVCGEVYVECVHDEGIIENCVKSCGNCGEVLDAEAHGEKVVNDNCDEVCADCGKIYAADVHAEGVVGDDCVKYCSRCNDVMETEVHADKIINDACEEVCSRCGKVYNTGMHEASVETYVDDYKSNVRTYTKGCARCGGNVEYSYTIQLGAKKPEVFVSAAQLAAIGMGDKFEKTVLSADGTYATFKSKAGQGGDANFYPFVGDGSVSGQYIIIKYRTTLDTKWEMWTSAGTNKTGASGGENFYYAPVANGEWQYLVIDLAKTKPNHFKAEEGKYCIDFFRWDIFNSSTASSATVDVAYVAIADSLTDLTATCTDVETVQVVVGSENKYYEVYVEGGTPAGSGTNVPGVAKPFYIFNMDNACNSTDGKVGGKNGMATVNKKLTTLANGRFTVYGWAGAYADIDRYQYSTDGGATWREFIGGDTTSNESGVVAAIKNAAPNLFDSSVTSIPNCRFRNLAADLSDCYGQTVSFIFAALLENGDRLSMVKYSEVEVTSCSHAIVADEDWADHETNPQLEAANCSWCKEFTYRMKTKTPQGLVLYNPEMLLACTSNGGYTGSIKTTESGMKYFSAVSSQDGKEGNLTIVDGGKLTNIGRYAFAIVRKNVGEATIQMYYTAYGLPKNTKANTELGVALGEDFQLLIFDMGTHAASGELGWVRFDLINGNKAVVGRDTADVAAIGFANNKEDAYKYFGLYIDAFDLNCNHVPDNSWTATENEGEIAMTCFVCDQLCNAMACTHADTTKLSNVTLKATASANAYYTADCALCGGVQVDVPSLTQEGNRVLTATELNALAYVQAGLAQEHSERYGYQLVTNDSIPYLRFTAKVAAECKLFLNDGTSAFTGVNDYVAILYRCTGKAGKNFEFFYNTAGVTNTTGVKSNTSTTLAVDGTWQLAIIKANQIASGKTDGYGWTRLDVINNTYAVGDIVDIAYVGFFSSEAESINYYKGYLEFVDCFHLSDGNYVTTGNVDEMKSLCTICGDYLVEPCSHPTSTVVATDVPTVFNLTCSLCKKADAVTGQNDQGLTMFDAQNVYDRAKNDGGTNYSVTKKTEGTLEYVRFETLADKAGSTEWYFWVVNATEADLTNVSDYFMIVYRASSGYPAGVDTFISNNDSLDGTHCKSRKLVTIGEWQVAIFDYSAASGYDDTKNVVSRFRIDIFNKSAAATKGQYIDIAYMGFFASPDKAYENYEKAVTKYGFDTANFYGRFDSINVNGTTYRDTPSVVTKADYEGGTWTANLSGITLNSVKALNIKGWITTPGGAASVSYRIVKADGTKSDLKLLLKPGAIDSTNGIAKDGTVKSMIYGTGYLSGVSYQGVAQTFDLTGYEGQTVSVEVVVVNNYGQEGNILTFTNVKVPG